MPKFREIRKIEDIETEINGTNIKELLSEENPFKIDSSAFYFYTKVMQYKFCEKFSDEFIERAYACLVAWGMDGQKAELEKFDNLKDSILKSKPIFESLEKSKLESISDNDFKKLEELFTNLQISKTDAKLVGFSKLVHFYLPNLVAPIDRTYTLNFFYPKNNGNEKTPSYFPSGKIENQFNVFKEIHKIYSELARDYNLEQYISNKGWNRNIPKIIDNAVMAAVRKRKSQTVKMPAGKNAEEYL